MHIDETVDSKIGSYSSAKLENDLRVVVCCRPKTCSFSWAVSIKAGSQDGKPHLAHLVEHLTCRNMEKMNRHSGFANAFTGVERTQYFSTGHAEDLGDAIESLVKIFQPLRAKPQRVKEELRILQREKAENGGISEMLCEAQGLVIGGDAMAKKYRASRRRLRSLLPLDAEDCNSFHERHYRTGNSRLTLISPLPAQEILGRIQLALKTEYATGAEPPEPTLAPPARRRLTWHYYPNTSATFCVWHNHPAESLAQRSCLQFANRILGGQGRLHDSIRTKNQIAYGVYSNVSRLDDQLSHSILINSKITKVNKTIHLVAAELDLINKAMPTDKFQLEINNCCRNLDLLEEDLYSLSEWLRRWNSNSASLVTPMQLRKSMQAITPDSFAGWASSFFQPKNRDAYLAGNFGPIGWLTARRFAKGQFAN